ncbi:methyltransferase domain-containing protein [Candidatus Woesearchaeota archaeon]|nr:methyltransferase domain-containing protein [Candidatus Woesearchaeota archaeon]
MDYREDYYTGIAGIYFRRVLNTIIRLGNLKSEEGLILDFGCGVGHLKRMLPGRNVVGYDLLPENTEIEDYRGLKPSVIVANGVFEHLTLPQLKEIIADFKKMNPGAILLTGLPTENWVSSVGMMLTGYTTAHDDHKMTLEEANAYLFTQCERAARKKVFTMMEVSKWRFKEGG